MLCPYRRKEHCSALVGQKSTVPLLKLKHHQRHHHFCHSKPAITLILGLLLFPTTSAAAAAPTSDAADTSNCVVEFELCVASRDCCHGLECVLGDWGNARPTVRVFPKKSQAVEAAAGLSHTQMVDLVKTFYDSVDEKKGEGCQNNTADKSDDEIVKIVHKYRTDFAKLISKLERKYHRDFSLPSWIYIDNSNGDGDDSVKTEEL